MLPLREQAASLQRGVREHGGPDRERRTARGSRQLEATRRILAAGASDRGRLEALTEREVEVPGLIGRGASSQEIAEALWITEPTVKTHVTPGSSASSMSVIERKRSSPLTTGLVTPGEGT